MPRKSGFTPEMGERICQHLADGMSLLSIAGLEGFPTEGCMRNWARKPEYSDQEFITSYARARIDGCDSQFEELREIEDRLAGKEGTTPIDPNAARALLDSIKWRLAKMIPDLYGERTHIEHSGSLKVETVKDHAPEWLQEMLTKPAEEPAEAETVH